MLSTLVIFLLVFVLFGWFIWRMLLYTRNTIGENSPLYVPRTYHVTAWQYFTSWHMVSFYLVYFAFLTMVAVLFVVVKVP